MKREALVGAFVIGGVVLLVAAFVLFGRFNPFERKVHAVLIFEGATAGLTVGAPVSFRGVQIGAVDKVAIDYDPVNRQAFIPVYITLQPKNISLTTGKNQRLPSVHDLVERGLRGEMNIKSFVTGTSEIDLDFAPDVPAVLHPHLVGNDEIPTRPSSIQQMKQTLTELPLRKIAENADRTMESLRALSDRLDQQIPALAGSLRETSDHTRALMDTARGTLDGLQPQLERTLEAVDKLAESGTTQINARGRQIDTVLARTDAVLQKANATLASLSGLASPRSAERANLNASLRDIAAAAAALRGFASDVERNPQLLLMGRRP